MKIKHFGSLWSGGSHMLRFYFVAEKQKAIIEPAPVFAYVFLQELLDGLMQKDFPFPSVLAYLRPDFESICYKINVLHIQAHSFLNPQAQQSHAAQDNYLSVIKTFPPASAYCIAHF